MIKEEQLKRLDEARALPTATLEDIRHVPEGISKEKLNSYLQNFLKPTGECWLCKSRLVMEWTLIHGIARCTNCGMDAKVYHYLRDVEGNEQRIEQTLQYHPNLYEEAE